MVTVTALIAWEGDISGIEWIWMNLMSFWVILRRVYSFWHFLTLWHVQNSRNVFFSTKTKSAAPEALRKTFKRNPAGFRPDSGRIPAGFRPDSGRIPAGFRPVSGRFPAGFRPVSGRITVTALIARRINTVIHRITVTALIACGINKVNTYFL